MRKCEGMALTIVVVAVLMFGAEAASYSGGTGIEADPYQIATVADWTTLSVTTSDWDKNFILNSDIDFGGISLTPVGNDTTKFTGMFDGNGHVVGNGQINLSASDYVGLFGYVGVGGEIHNLGVNAVEMTGNNYVGGLAGWNDGTVVSCFSTCTATGVQCVGGLIGENYTSGTITSCYATGAVTGTRCIGGLVGENRYLMTSCYATGAVINGDDYVGGLVGNSANLVIGCFWDTESSGRVFSDGGRGLTTIQMGTISYYQNAGWNAYPWVMMAGTFPRLAWEGLGWPVIPTPEPLSFAGAGTEVDPYLITSPAEFSLLSWHLSILDKHFRLMADLDLSGVMLYPIGDMGPFTGVFDGSGHVVRNGKIDLYKGDQVGLFGYVGVEGEIHNLGVEAVYMRADDRVGGLVGLNYGTISLCYVTGTVAGDNNVGGLVGSNVGTITFCCTIDTVRGDWSIGGLVGYNYSGGSVSSCYAKGAVTGNSVVGGLLGYNRGAVTSCYSTGILTVRDDYIGGLVGYKSGAITSSCYWDVQTTGQTSSAGGEGRTTDEMTYPYSSNTYVDWNFTGVWAEDSDYMVNYGYPYLLDCVPPNVVEGEGETPFEGEQMPEGEGEDEVILGEMISIPACTFTMGRTSTGDDSTYGSTNEDPQHSVTLGAYQIGKYEVTNQQYCDVLNWALAQGHLYSDSAGTPWAGTGDIYAGNSSGTRYLIVEFTSAYCNLQYSGGVFTSKTRVGLPTGTTYSMDTHPMVMVSWYGSVAYCDWISQIQGLTPCYDMATADWPLTIAPPTSGGYRLPTEAEWERAAAWNGTKHWIYSFMSDTNLSGTANRCNDSNLSIPDNPLGLTSYLYTSPVGWFNGTNVSPNGSVTTVNSPSPVGAYDLSGNVWEWCHDWYLNSYYSGGSMTNPTGPAAGSYRVSRGGAWGGDFLLCRSALRNSGTPTAAGRNVGFRLSKSNGEGEGEGEGEILVEGEGEIHDEGEGEVLPEGEGEVQIEGEGEVLPEGEGEGESLDCTGPIWYVNDDNIEPGDGCSWTTALTSIQDAVNIAYSFGGGEVWVAAGTYRNTTNPIVTMKEGVRIYGGFNGTETERIQRDRISNLTKIDGENARKCIVGANNAVLDGFTVTRGTQNTGSGLYCSGVSPTIINCIFVAHPESAVFIKSGGSPIFMSCDFLDCAAVHGGAAVIGLDGSTTPPERPIFYRCKFMGNSATKRGGAVWNNDYSEASFFNCIFDSNHGTLDGGAIDNDASSPHVVNCLFVNNITGGTGGGIANTKFSGTTLSKPVVMNCTFVNNQATTAGAYSGGGAGNITNSIIYDNIPLNTSGISGSAIVSFSCVQNGYTGEGNINANPQFINPDADDYQLQSSSPCKDTGTSVGSPLIDIIGITRPQGTGFDMGAYEYLLGGDEGEGETEGESEELLAYFAAHPDQGIVPLAVTFTNYSVGYNGLLWDFGDGSQSTDISPTHIFATAGSFSVTLRVWNADGEKLFYRSISVSEDESEGEGEVPAEGENECSPDLTPPVLTCKNITLNLDAAGVANLFSAGTLYTTSAITRLDDACDGSWNSNPEAFTITGGPNFFDCKDVDVPVTTYIRAEDSSGNTVECILKVTVKDPLGTCVVDECNPDDLLPEIECRDIELELDETGIVSLFTASALYTTDAIVSLYDNCEGAWENNPEGFTITAIPDVYTCVDVGGSIPAQIFVTDSSGNLSVCNFSVTVTDPLGVCSVEEGEGEPMDVQYRGDANLDGTINFDDVEYVILMAGGLVTLPPDSPSWWTADVDGNGDVTSDDALLVLLFVRAGGLITAAPQALRAESGGNQVTLFWEPVTHANLSGYAVYRRAEEESEFVRIGKTTSTVFTDAEVSTTRYFYYVVALDIFENAGPPSETASVWANMVRVWLPEVWGDPGTTVRIPLNFGNARGITPKAMIFNIRFDAGVLSYDHLEKTVLSNDVEFLDQVDGGNLLRIISIDPESSIASGEGRFLDLYFKVASTAPAGCTPLALEKTIVLDLNDVPVATIPQSGQFCVGSDVRIGDLNGDGFVDEPDVMLLLAIITQTVQPTPYHRLAGDLNCDERFDSADVALLLRVIAGLPLNPAGKTLPKAVEGGTVHFGIPDLEEHEGSQFTLPVTLSMVNAVAGIDIVASWPKTELILNTARLGELFVSSTFALKQGDGYCRFSLGNVGGISAPADTVIAYLDFTVSGKPTTSMNPAPVIRLNHGDVKYPYGESHLWFGDITLDDAIIKILAGSGEGEGEVPAEGEGEAPVEGEGEAPVEGEGEIPVEGEGEMPAEGEGEVPTEGEVPLEGEGEILSEGETPIEGEGETSSEGEVSAEGEVLEGEGEGIEGGCGCGCDKSAPLPDAIKRRLGDFLLLGLCLSALIVFGLSRS